MTIREDGWDEILLLRETNEQIAIWEGARLTQDQARELSGIRDVRWTNEYDTLLDTLVPAATMVFVEANQHPRCTCPVETRNARMTKELKEKFPDAVLKNVYEIMAEMRQIKSRRKSRRSGRLVTLPMKASGRCSGSSGRGWGNGRSRAFWLTNSSAGAAQILLPSYHCLRKGHLRAALHPERQEVRRRRPGTHGHRHGIRKLQLRHDPHRSRERKIHPTPARRV